LPKENCGIAPASPDALRAESNAASKAIRSATAEQRSAMIARAQELKE